MTSETFVFCCPIPEKIAIGAKVRAFAATQGAGKVEAIVVKTPEGLRVPTALAYPITACEYSVRQEVEQHLNQ